jgi:hypothetical protein
MMPREHGEHPAQGGKDAEVTCAYFYRAVRHDATGYLFAECEVGAIADSESEARTEVDLAYGHNHTIYELLDIVCL